MIGGARSGDAVRGTDHRDCVEIDPALGVIRCVEHAVTGVDPGRGLALLLGLADQARREAHALGLAVEDEFADATGEVGSPMPGRVISVHVQEDETVDAGAPLLTLEAMKMETVVRAPLAGEVRELCTDTGAQVLGGDLLVVVEPGA